MPDRDNSCQRRLGAIAEANAQFHWGTRPDELRTAARNLRGLDLNPGLSTLLDAKAGRMRAVDALLRDAAFSAVMPVPANA